MNPDAYFSIVTMYPWEILKRLLLDKNRLSQVLFIGTEHLCGFSTLRATKKLIAILTAAEKYICECTCDTFCLLPELSPNIDEI